MMRSIAAAALLVAAPLAPAPAQSLIAGTYVGEMFSNSALQPTDTTFFFKGDSYAGTYVIHDPEDGDVHGKIVDMTQDPGGTWTFTWKDMYGQGPATVAFAPSGSSFTGKWYFDGQPIGVWNGIRQD